jgi:hypothetical protein
MSSTAGNRDFSARDRAVCATRAVRGQGDDGARRGCGPLIRLQVEHDRSQWRGASVLAKRSFKPRGKGVVEK